jgi:hypothetical protein
MLIFISMTGWRTMLIVIRMNVDTIQILRGA